MRSTSVRVLLLCVALACGSPTVVEGPSNVAYGLIGGGRVLFRGASTSYLIDSDARTIASVGGSGTISPNGSQVVFLAFDPGADRTIECYQGGSCYDVWASDIDGTQHRRIASIPGNSEDAPSWTPDGTGVIVAMSYGEYPATGWRIIRYDATTGSSDTVASALHGPDDNVQCPYAGGGASDGLSIAPSGDIVFACAGEALYVFSAADSSLRRVTPAPAFQTRYYVPTWSPDGTAIAFIEELVGSTHPLTLKALFVGTGLVQTVAPLRDNMSMHSVDNGPPSLCWNASGTRIIFAANSLQGRMYLYSVAASGGTPKRIMSGWAMETRVSCTR